MHKSRPRRLTMIIMLIIGVFALQYPIMALGSVQSAYAESSDVGGGSGGSGGNGGIGGAKDGCKPSTGEGLLNGKVWYLAPFPGCYGAKYTNYIASCPVGFDVWRFYGNASNPTQFTTVSHTGVPNWCQKNRVYRYFLPNPQDAGVGVGTPWAISRFTNPYGDTISIADNAGDCGDPRNSTTCFATSNPPHRYLINGADSMNATCANLQTGAPVIQKYFSGAYANPNAPEYQAGLAVRKGLLSLFSKWASQTSAAIGLTAINSGQPIPNAAGNGSDINYDDGLPCSSALDFASQEGNTNPVVMGTCVIPVNKFARQYSGGSGPQYAFYTAQYNAKLAASRYTNEYASAAASQRDGIYGSWRAMIRHEVLTRGGSLGNEIPGQPYDVDGGLISPSQIPASDKGAAAEAAALNSYCFKADAAVYNEIQSNAEPTRAEYLKIRLTAPDVFQVGGSTKPGKVTTSTAQLICPGGRICNANTTPGDPTLASLTYTLNLKGVNFDKCSNKFDANCEYFIEVPAKPNWNGQTVTGWFYSGTNPDQKVAITLDNLSATQQLYKETVVTLKTCTPTSSVGSVTSTGDCETLTMRPKIPYGDPVPVEVRVDTGDGKGAVKVPSDGTVALKDVIGAVGTSTN